MNFSQKGAQHKQDEINSAPKRVSTKVFIITFRAFIVLLIAATVIGIFLVSGFVKGLLDTSPDISKLTVVPDKFPTKIYDSDGKVVQELKGAESNREYVTIDKIPDTVQKAFISIEDERFYEHNGIDIKGIFRASFNGLSDGFSQGASTITQQLIKNRIFESGMETSLSAKIERKIQEQYLAIKLENKLSKDEILEYYLNTINLGAGTYGVQTASKEYFDKPVSKLTISEAAVIASITQQPTTLNPIEHPDKNKTRMLNVLKKMYKNKYITKKEYEEAKKDKVYDRIKAVNLKKKKEKDGSTKVNSYFVDALYYEVLEDLVEKAGYDQETAKNMLNSGGLKIYSTLDSSMQETCDKISNDKSNYPNSIYQLDYQLSITTKDDSTKNYSTGHLEKYFKETKKKKNFDLYFTEKENANKYIKEFKEHVLKDGGKFIADKKTFTLEPQVSFVIIEQSSGKVKALVGGRGDKTGSLSFNRVTDAKRQPGSTFKPLSSFLPALDTSGMTLATVQDDTTYHYKGTNKEVRSWRTNHKGLTSIREAIYDSNNVVTVKTLEEVGVPVSLNYLTNLGFTTLDKKHDTGATIGLGGLTYGVTNLELTAAYASIANKGVYHKPHYYTKVVDNKGKVILQYKDSKKQVMKATTAWLLTDAMHDVVTKGTGTSANLSGMRVAGKTGTTSDNLDLWFAGFTPYYTAAIWTGYDKNDRTAYGSSYHKKMWKKIMQEVHKGLSNKDFTRPSGITSVTICTKCGKKAVDGLCSNAYGAEHGRFVRTEYFASGTIPTEYCTCHQKIKVCTVTGHLASEFCPSEERVYLIKDETSKTADSNYIAPSDTQTVCTQCDGTQIINDIFNNNTDDSDSDDNNKHDNDDDNHNDDNNNTNNENSPTESPHN